MERASTGRTDMQLNVSFERYTDKIGSANVEALTRALHIVVQEFIQKFRRPPACR